MKPSERENKLYSDGKQNTIGLEETLLFDFLNRYQSPPGHLADIGCGTGEIATALVHKGYVVSGFDFSDVAIRKAREHGLNAEQVDLDERGIPLPDVSVDCIYAGDVIEHVFDPIMLFKEFHRILRSGGIVVASLPHDANMSNIRLALLGRSFQEPIYQSFGHWKHHSFVSVDLLKLFASKGNLSLLELVLIGRKYPFIRTSNTIQRRFWGWKVPLISKYLSHSICIALKKV